MVSSTLLSSNLPKNILIETLTHLILSVVKLPPNDSNEYKQLLEFDEIRDLLVYIKRKQETVLTELTDNSFIKLTKLDLTKSYIDNSHISKISSLITLGNLQQLYLSYNWIGDQEVATLGSVLSKNTNLIELKLDHNLISDDGAGSFAAHIKSNTTLEVLDLSYNRVASKGVEVFASKLSKPSLSFALKVLNLSCNKIDTEHASKLLNCLNQNTTLEELYLAYNNIESPMNLTSLIFTDTLKIIDLSYNWLKDDEGLKLCKIVSDNSSLHTIKIKGHTFSKEVIEKLANAIQTNHTLKTLEITINSWPELKEIIKNKISINNKVKPCIYEQNGVVEGAYFNDIRLTRWSSSLDNTPDTIKSCILSMNALTSIPSSIQKFKHLVTLDLRYNAICFLPVEIEHLTTLENLLLSNNNLHFLPRQLAKLKQLRRLYLANNPLQLIPADIRIEIGNFDDFKFARSRLYKYLTLPRKDEYIKFNKAKLMIVGEPSVGKTTLSKSLGLDIKWYQRIGVQKPKTPNVATDGIDISTIVTNTSDSLEIIWEVWDYGGHDIYKTTHSFFICPRTIYLILFNLNDYNKHNIEYWLQSIRTKVGTTTPILIVGTYSDAIRSSLRDKIIQEIKETYKHYVTNVMYVSNSNYEGISSLKQYIAALAVNSNMVGKNVPRSYVELAHQISKIRTSIPYLTLEQIFGLFEANGISKRKYDEILTWLSDTGEILHFEEKSVAKNVFIDPQFLCKMFSDVVSMKYLMIGNHSGILTMSSLINIWKLPHEVRLELLNILQAFNVATILNKEQIDELSLTDCKILVPALLQDEKPSNYYEYWKPKEELFNFNRVYKFKFLPFGFFSKILVRCLHIPDIEILCYWKNGLVGKRNEELFKLKFDPKETVLKLCVNGRKEGRNLPLLNSCIKSTIEEWYPSSVYSIYIPVKIEDVGSTNVIWINQNEITSLIDEGIYHKDINNNKRIDFLTLVPDLALLDIKDMEINYSEIEHKELLGRGSFGEVYKSVYKNETIAFKSLVSVRKHEERDFLDKDQYHEYRSKYFDNFKHEIRIMSMLKHENIVQLKGFITSPVGIVMEYMPHGNLLEFIKGNKNTMSWEYRIRVALDISKGMTYMHSSVPPLCHRDLRSENVLLNSLDETAPIVAKVSDFGLSVFVFDTLGKSPNQSFFWLAPEVLNDKSHSQKSDVFSFGVIISELYNQELPYHLYKTNEQTKRMIKNGEISPIFIDIDENVENRELILQFCQIGKECCSYDPKDRPTFHEIVPRLEKLLELFRKDSCSSENSTTLEDTQELKDEVIN